MSGPDMKNNQLSRLNIVEALNALISLENADKLTVSSWASNVASLTQVSGELTSDTVAKALSVSSSILIAAIAAGSSTGSIADILYAIDGVFGFGQEAGSISSNSSGGGGGSNNRRTLTIPDSTDTTALSLLNKYGRLATSTVSMAGGQSSVDNVLDNFRISSQVFAYPYASSGCNITMSAPLTLLELATNTPPTVVTLPFMDNVVSRVNLVTIKQKLVNLTNSYSDGVNASALVNGTEINGTGMKLISNAVQIQFQVDSTCDHPSTTASTMAVVSEFIFTIQHTDVIAVADTLSSSLAPVYSTQCSKGLVSTATLPCAPSGITVYCNGTIDYNIVVTCPQVVWKPVCVLTNAGFAANQSICRVLNYTSQYTTCACDVCSSAAAMATGSKITGGNNDDYTTSDVSSSPFTFLQLIVIGQSSLSGLIEALDSANSFNSIQSILNTLAISGCFMVLWFGSAVLLFVKERLYPDKHKPKATDTLPQHAGVTNPLTLRDTIARPSAVALGQNSNAKTAKSDARRRRLEAYAFSLFPKVYANVSLFTRISQALVGNHPLLSLFSLKQMSSFERWMRLFQFNTALSYGLFMLAVLYSIQFPTGEEDLHTSAAYAVSSTVFVFNRACLINYCTWHFCFIVYDHPYR
jgi:hypothetical protein